MKLSHRIRFGQFLSTPSVRRATVKGRQNYLVPVISIHALREEGDAVRESGRTASKISIHALREEGDLGDKYYQEHKQISIHALREEGDFRSSFLLTVPGDFYPRPP